jgi:hypothetical protein
MVGDRLRERDGKRTGAAERDRSRARARTAAERCVEGEVIPTQLTTTSVPMQQIAVEGGPVHALDAEEIHRLDAYWRAANYLSVGQIYLMDNPLLREPLRPEHIKPRLLGHWGTTPGPQLCVRASQPRDQGARPQRHLYLRPRPWRPCNGSQYLPRRNLQRGLSQNPARMPAACASCFANSHSPAEYRAMRRPRLRAQSMKAANLGIPSRTLLELRAITRI